uniref:Uncharacterized protein n=1 Tax=Rhizophora mucronata TaxID=61149 RepID=A0A2P2QYM3_RHIMU
MIMAMGTAATRTRPLLVPIVV